MKRSLWSIADLDRQQLAVGRLALLVELDRRELHEARARVGRSIRATVSAPLALGGCFLAGVAFGRAAAPLADSAVSGRRRLGRLSAFAVKVLQVLALSRVTAPRTTSG
jgi:hypothetical protein